MVAHLRHRDLALDERQHRGWHLLGSTTPSLASVRAPDYAGGGLVNLAAELEYRLHGRHEAPRLYPALAGHVPPARTYVLVLFDGLGDLQLTHPAAGPFRASRRAALDAAFSTQTTVNVATLAMGTPPSHHGLVAYLLRIGTRVVNTIWWFDLAGLPVEIDLGGFLPTPNLPERLAQNGIETVVVEPAAYEGSPLSKVLFRSVTSVPYEEDVEAVDVALSAAAEPDRLVLLYLPHVDAAAHAEGQQSDSYAEMVGRVAGFWADLQERLPPHAVAIGTADHGHVDATVRLHVEPPEGVVLHGDSRCIWVAGDASTARRWAADLPVQWIDRAAMDGWWGPEPFSNEAASRLPQGALLADEGVAIHYPGNATELVGYHGGVSEAELRIPLLVAYH